ncbi:MAG: hypothetical protein NT175_09040 [Bacteroidetes bacterium]|nr:hypothetical protein [Bacteroidota bacterium]
MLRSLFTIILFSFFSLIIISCGNKTANTTKEAQEQIMLSVADFDSLVQQYVGKEVVLSGTVVHVCRESGKRMFLMDGDSSKRVKVTVGGNISSFDIALEGSDIVVKGIVDELKIDEAYLLQWEDEIKKQESEVQQDSTASSGQGMYTGLGEKIDQGNHQSPYDVINQYRQEVDASGKGFIAFYSIVCNKIEEKKE